MLDENEVCEEVQALLNRMEMFPEEFSNELHSRGRWSTVIRGLDDSLNAFTKAEQTLLTEKIREIARVWMKRAVLKEITNVESEDDLTNLLKDWEAPTTMVVPPSMKEQFSQLARKATQGKSKQDMQKERLRTEGRY